MDLAIAESQLRVGDVVAVVVPHFLGMAADMSAWRTVCDRWSVPLIEDSAQLLPGRAAHVPAGDFVVLSFGRGKPLNAGGGGALLSRQVLEGDRGCDWATVSRASTLTVGRARANMARAAFNTAIRPLPYHWLRMVPFLGIGETRYKQLTSISPMSPASARSLWSGLRREPPGVSDAQTEFAKRFASLPNGWIDLPRKFGAGVRVPLLRYPLLAPSRAIRDRLIKDLRRLGASSFYGAALTDLPGVPTCDIATRVVRARAFAERLLTLPVHSAVSTADCVDIIRTLSRRAEPPSMNGQARKW